MCCFTRDLRNKSVFTVSEEDFDIAVELYKEIARFGLYLGQEEYAFMGGTIKHRGSLPCGIEVTHPEKSGMEELLSYLNLK